MAFQAVPSISAAEWGSLEGHRPTRRWNAVLPPTSEPGAEDVLDLRVEKWASVPVTRR